MISLLEGSVYSRNEQSIIILVNGIGFEIYVTHPQSYTMHEKITIQVYTHWNQEHGFSLFGFRHSNEQTMFMLLLSCSGIGPKIALSILTLPLSDIIQSIVHKKPSILNRVSGVGTKKAELIVLQLYDKVNNLLEKGILHITHDFEHIHQLNLVLQSLNYSKHEIHSVLEAVRTDHAYAQLPFDALLKKALHMLTLKQRQV
jgi:holliday junction DNA helicase RuvA